MFRQLIFPAAIVVIALVGIGSFLVNTEKSNNAVAEKKDLPPSISELQPELTLNEREQQLNDINLILASRVPQFTGGTPDKTRLTETPWLDPALDDIYQQLRNLKLSIRFPYDDETFAIWVGNPYKIVNGKKVYEHSEVLKKAVPLINQLPFPVRIWFYGTRDESNPELGECIESLASVSKLGGIKFSYCRINEQGYKALQTLPNLTNLEILRSFLTDAGFNQIVQNKKIRRLHTTFGNQKISSQTVDKITELPELENLKLVVTLDPQSTSSFWKKLSACETLVDLDVDCGSVTRKMLVNFLKEGDHQRLHKWRISGVFPQKELANTLALAPNLEDLHLPSGSMTDTSYLLEQLSKHQPHMRSLSIGWSGGENYLKGDDARTALSQLARFPNLETFFVPIQLPDPEALQPLIRLRYLEDFYCKNLNLNQATLLELAQMPSLRKLTVDSLEFGQEAAHILPWLSNVEQIEINNPTTLTDARLSLLATMPHLTELKWCDITLKEPIPLTDKARSRFQYINFDVCKK